MQGGTELGRVRGLGAAKEGTHHWTQQRLTALGNLILVPWLIASLALLPAYDYATLSAWLGSAWAAIPMLLLVVSVFYHARLGLQVLIEDYVHGPAHVALMALLNLAAVAGGATAVLAILRLALAGGAA